MFVAEHDDAGSPRRFIRLDQGATDQGRHPCRAERVGRELRHLDHHGRPTADDEISSIRAIRPKVFDRLQLAPPFEEVAKDAALGRVRQRVVRLDLDDAIAGRQRDCG
jgi:hypothetical protein